MSEENTCDHNEEPENPENEPHPPLDEDSPPPDFFENDPSIYNGDAFDPSSIRNTVKKTKKQAAEKLYEKSLVDRLADLDDRLSHDPENEELIQVNTRRPGLSGHRWFVFPPPRKRALPLAKTGRLRMAAAGRFWMARTRRPGPCRPPISD